MRVGGDRLALVNGEDLVSLNMKERLFLSTGPVDLNAVYNGDVAQPKMNTLVT